MMTKAILRFIGFLVILALIAWAVLVAIVIGIKDFASRILRGKSRHHSL